MGANMMSICAGRPTQWLACRPQRRWTVAATTVLWVGSRSKVELDYNWRKPSVSCRTGDRSPDWSRSASALRRIGAPIGAHRRATPFMGRR